MSSDLSVVKTTLMRIRPPRSCRMAPRVDDKYLRAELPPLMSAVIIALAVHDVIAWKSSSHYWPLICELSTPQNDSNAEIVVVLNLKKVPKNRTVAGHVRPRDPLVTSSLYWLVWETGLMNSNGPDNAAEAAFNTPRAVRFHEIPVGHFVWRHLLKPRW